MQRWHMVQCHTQGVEVISSSNPNAAMRRNFRGSIPSSPVAGQPEEHAPHVRQRFKFPPSGRISFTLSIKVLSFLPPSLIAASPIWFILQLFYRSGWPVIQKSPQGQRNRRLFLNHMLAEIKIYSTQSVFPFQQQFWQNL